MNKKRTRARSQAPRCPYCGSTSILRCAEGIYRENSKIPCYIMSADEYSRLIDAAASTGNHTMVRLIAKNAADMAEKANDADVARSYRLVSHKGKGDDGSEYLRAFDFLVDTFNRCERNFALTPKWAELTSPVVESF